ncbi:MAG: thymidine phosphorylase [Planctomycetes bacterium]|nr:thymidine phosphorylase [Planctomycetota bacterium]
MDARGILATKRDGKRLSEAQIRGFMAGYVAGEITDHHASALLMAIFLHGMEEAELAAWTHAMLESGRVMKFPGISRPKVDKHSTGGIGDTVSIPLAPAAAACGLAVPMISGRGLGHTGGTLDKLEAIPGFCTQLSEADFARCLERTGVALGGQTPDIVPADRKLYALRDVTGLIESLPLIASSIMSKKLAEGLDALVLDVKFGSGAFMMDRSRGEVLAKTMLGLARDFGVRATALHTNMERPLGRMAGHALEIAESFDCLEGRGPADLRELVCLQGGEMLRLGGLVRTLEDGKARIARSLDDGSARATFVRVIEEQGGDPRCMDERARLPKASQVELVRAGRDGVLAWRDLRALGGAICELGGGRKKLGDAIDHGVGLEFEVPEGAAVRVGDVLLRVHHEGRGLAEALALVERSFELVDAHAPAPLVLATWTA